MTKLYAGLDVSKEETALCVRNAEGRIILEGKTPTDPDAINRELARCQGHAERIVFETGRMANWLHRQLLARELPAVCIDARHAHAVLSQLPKKPTRTTLQCWPTWRAPASTGRCRSKARRRKACALEGARPCRAPVDGCRQYHPRPADQP
jgi:hypothetical protein